MNKSISAPIINNYIYMLSDTNRRNPENKYIYDAESYKYLDELFDLLSQIVPTRDDKIWDLWIRSNRGPVSDFANVDDEDDRDCYGFSNQEELEKIWKEYYPYEILWYNFCAVESDSKDYRAIFIGNKQVIEIDKRKSQEGFEHDISEFAAWLLASIKEVVAELEDGTYNKKVANELPPELKTGTILRKHYFDAFPELRQIFYTNLTDTDITDFICIAGAETSKEDIGRISAMTADEYFTACAIGYKVNNYKDCTRSPKEQYKGNADGRDEGLTEIDENSPEAFQKWYHDDNRHGGHPWEIFPGGNSTHISLYVREDEKGFYYVLAGSSESRCVETIRMYVALRKNGIPVLIEDRQKLIDRVTEKEKIGIVPMGVIPRYCHSMFPGENIINFMNLPYEQDEIDKMLPFCVWQPLKQISLKIGIIKNAIRCNLCGDEIESTYRHNYVTCKCGACSVDGGHDYLRRCFRKKEDYTDISIVRHKEE